MVTSSVYVDIKRSLSDVWDYLMNSSNYLKWHDGISELVTTDEMHKGSTLTLTSSGLGQPIKMTAIITENDEKSCFVARSNRGPIDFVYKHQLIPIAGGTRVEVVSQINAHATLHLAENVLQESSDYQNISDLQQLKVILEGIDQPSII